MPRRDVKKSGIEMEVLAYLSKFRNASLIRTDRRYIQKAIDQINFFLNVPCCSDPNAEITFSRFDNGLTRYINAVLGGPFDRRKWRKSLERAVTALRNALTDPCCEFVTFRFHSDVPTFNWCTGEWSCDYGGGSVVSSIWLAGCDFPPNTPSKPFWFSLPITNEDVNGDACSGTLVQLRPVLEQWLIDNGYEEFTPLTMSEDGMSFVTPKEASSDCSVVLMDITPTALGYGGAHTPPPVGDDDGQPDCP